MIDASLPELDARTLPPPIKHGAIFAAFEALAEGESFVLVNDHDPLPLRYQFEFTQAGCYGWEYLASGPSVWRVQISRVAPGQLPDGHAPLPTEKPSCGCGGHH